jgi:flavin reductase (DIM6/NTAB) family NADH-FMN oxidoreductase RutF
MPHAIAPAEFREVLARFASGVTVVAAYAQGGPVGMTASAFTAASLVPPLVIVSVAHTASVHDDLVRAPAFGVSLLEAGQSAIARKFADPDADRFTGTPLRDSAHLHVPLVEGALAYLECRHHAVHKVGDHSVIVGEVAAGAAAAPAGGRPLVHFGRVFGTFVQ